MSESLSHAVESREGLPLFGAALREQRQDRGITQIELAALLGTSRQYVWSVETGRQTVGPSQAARMARLLGASERDFIELALQDLLRASGFSLNVRVQPD